MPSAMPRMISSLAELGRRYDTLFCDLWGCVHDGARAFPAAVAALRAYRAGGGRVVLMTNAPRPSPAIAESFARIGIPRDAWDLLVSSGDASRAVMIEGEIGRRVHHIGPAKDHSFFTETSDGMDPSGIERVALEAAEGIVCTGPVHEETETPEDYRATFEAALARNLPLLCTNPDIVVDMGEDRIWCAGALAALYEEMGGRAIYCGKPHPPIYALARHLLERTGHAPGRVLCVGDGIATDVQGGLNEGLDTLFIAGGLAAEHFGPDRDNPDPEALRAWLQAEGRIPTHAIGMLR